MKVLVIGIDGGTWDVILPLVEQGRLPTFEKLIKGGAWGILKSTVPPVTVPAWPAFVTGKNPGKFGVFDFLVPDENNPKGRIARSYDIKSKKLWDYLGHFGKKSIIVNLPLSYPPEKINGIMITGMLTPAGGKFVYPDEIEGVVRQLDYKIEIDPELVSKYWDKPKFINALIEIMNSRCRLATYLLNNYEWDFFFILFRETDVVQHKLFKQREKVAIVYEHLDKNLSILLDEIELDETIVVLMSDHGFSPLRKKFYVNNWLCKLGLLKTKKTELDQDSSKLVKIFTRFKITQDRVLKLLKKLKLEGIVYKVVPAHIRSKVPVTALDVDFNNSMAYSGGYITSEATYILLNRKLLNEDHYENVRDHIINELKNLKDPDTGEPIVENVFKGEELFRGEFSANAPDIVMLLRKGYVMATQVTQDPKITENVLLPAGTHDSEGIVVFYGRDVRPQKMRNDATIYDLAPTILHLFDLPIPNDMDGKVLTEIFKPNSELAKRKPIYVDPSYYDKLNEQEKIKAKVRELKLKEKI